MPHQTEPSANNALGSILQGMLGKATVRSENTQIIQGHAGLQPDILVTATGRSPVVIEAEYDPAQNVEPEARDRLNLRVNGQTRPIEAAIALLPKMTFLAEQVTRNLFPLLGYENLEMEFTLASIDALVEDENARTTRETQLLDRGVLTINEVRRTRNLPDVPWGNTHPQARGPRT